MSTITGTTRSIPVVDRAAIRLGTVLVAWGRAHAARRSSSDSLERYRSDYEERARTAAAIDQAHLLP
ncbi:MAG TPA: hypothetical protein VN133_07630 [Humibacter sp.]|jgi:hypothetical protein|nr:hypothetical protein [Humibacter sp.]